MTVSASTRPAPPTVWGVLRHPGFKGLWSGGSVYFIGNAMLTMAAAWRMVEVDGSSFLAALVQTASFLPMFLLVLPAGVLADISDRRRLIQRALGVQAVLVALLSVLTMVGAAPALLILLLIFVSGCCTALMSPAWNSSIAESVPRDELPQAITLVGIAFNAARAVGPALAGAAFLWIGAGGIFSLAVAGTLWFMHMVRRHPPAPHPPTRLPPERLWGGTMSAIRFARHSEVVLAQLVRTVAFGAAGSALWALLPAVGQQQLGQGAAGYGLLMGCMGGGAVLTGLWVGRARTRIGLERLVGGACIVYATVTVVAAFSRQPALTYPALVAAGGAWMAAMSTFNTATQTSVPPWVRARANALHTLSALGPFAIGSAFWGALAVPLGLSNALSLSALAMLTGLVLMRRFPLRVGALREVTPASVFDDFHISEQPHPDAGPVAVEIAYQVDPAHTAAFLEAVALLRAPRQRDGATFWRLYRDLGGSGAYVERFIVDSWADYLHQRSRATQADEALEAQVRAFLVDGSTVQVRHYIAEQ
ncbi:MFS transporter [Aquabacterium sp. J223]|uniref:MFS transporter n=1 Tax=Aquabacterium sp. J223 TaxID=2898431 RepID=UPI0021ADD811|nr:MFS transporter [Aquabacterium sp. J223]UUX93967.1 MFS transporter [Aquabacterium sp. J223]